MKLKLYILFFLHIFFYELSAQSTSQKIKFKKCTYIVYNVDLRCDTISIHWKDTQGHIYKSFEALNNSVQPQGKQLTFAINGGIYDPGNIVKGLYIENGSLLSPPDTAKGYGNFYTKPNGIFMLTQNNKANIINTTDYFTYQNKSEIKYAIQSGPLLIDSFKIQQDFPKKVKHKYTRSAVCITDNGELKFVISEHPISLFSFNTFLVKKLKCKKALYLDGAICRMYLPGQNKLSLVGNFASIITIVKNKQ